MYECGDITGIAIPASVTNIGMNAFNGTSYYNDTSNWTDSVLYIDNCLIDTKKELSGDYQIKNGTRVIAENSFSKPNNLTSVTIPDSVTNIGYGAFDLYKKNVDLIFTSPSAPKLDRRVFSDDCKIHVHEGFEGYTYENGYDESKIIAEPHNYIDGICSVCGAKKPISIIERTDSDSDSEYCFNVTPKQHHENCYVYAAIYSKNNVLIALEQVKVSTSEKTTSVSVKKSEDDALAKVFVWTNLMQPLEAEEFLLT